MTLSQKTYHVDYAVVGSGVAGVRAAIELSQAGTVLVLAKSDLSDSATSWAQGGIAVALSDEDEIGLHEQDTPSTRAMDCAIQNPSRCWSRKVLATSPN